MRRPSTLTSATLIPSLKASMDKPNSRAERPLSERLTLSGVTLTSGSPSVRDGRGLTRLPLLGGKTPKVEKNTFLPTL